MCIVDKLTFSTCPHTTLLPLYPCTLAHAPSPTTPPTCRPIINKYLHAPTSTSCLPCHLTTLHTIRTDFARRYLSLSHEAQSLGWYASDISGSVLELQIEMEKAIADLNVESLKYKADEKVDLRTFAESIRFQFGSVSGPVKFSAGCDRTIGVMKTKGKKMTRVRVLKSEEKTMSKCEEKAPWVVDGRGGRMSAKIGMGRGMARVQVLRAEARMGSCEGKAPWVCV